MHWRMTWGNTMGLSKQYDTFYQSTLEKEVFSEIVLDRWPRNRLEAILHTVNKSIPDGENFARGGYGI